MKILKLGTSENLKKVKKCIGWNCQYKEKDWINENTFSKLEKTNKHLSTLLLEFIKNMGLCVFIFFNWLRISSSKYDGQGIFVSLFFFNSVFIALQKLTKHSLSIVFNEACIKGWLLSEYTIRISCNPRCLKCQKQLSVSIVARRLNKVSSSESVLKTFLNIPNIKDWYHFIQFYKCKILIKHICSLSYC